MNNYKTEGVVGRGAYGTVYLARRKSDKKLLIIKQIPVEQMTREERLGALNEVKVLSMLDHPNIIQYYENFLEDKALMIVMEYAEGGTLFNYLQNRGERLLEEEEILHFFAQMLLSLQHVHTKQILHRDLKTQNILLDRKQQMLKIGDFGISKVLSSKSKAYTVVGTPCYISPELCEGKPYNQKSDIWALGCVLYELTTLKRAFEAQNLPALILKIMRGTFAPIPDCYSKELKDLILHTLHLDPSKRPNINQIMAMPIMLNPLSLLLTDFGKIPCRRIPRPMSNISGPGRRASKQAQAIAGSIVMDAEHFPSNPTELSNVYCWGNGMTQPVKMPLPSKDTQVTCVSVGRTQKAAVTKSGRLLVWEEPGIGSEISSIPGESDGASCSFIPRYLEGQSVTIQHVACGDLFTACLTDRGILMTFGSGANGCLGHGNYNDVQQAKIVEKLLGFSVIQVSCSSSHILAVTNEHELFAWGRGDNGRLGLGTADCQSLPQEVEIAECYKPSSVQCGLDCSAVLTLDCNILCCGSNRNNKLALNTAEGRVEEVDIFTPISTEPLKDTPLKFISLGTSHSAAINETGELYTFGSNKFGQLGLGKQKEGLTPMLVETLKDCDITLVTCGDTFTVAASRDGSVFSWGKSSRGRLGRSDEETDLPRRITLGTGENLKAVSMSSSHGTTLISVTPMDGASGSDC